MTSLEELIRLLTDKDNKAACRAARELCRLSGDSDRVYPYFPLFAELLDSPNSLARNRGLALLAANARWDKEGRLAALLPRYLAHIQDDKPITARQCIQALPQLAAARPELAGAIRASLEQADISGYGDSMRPLLEKDIQEALAALGPEDKG